MLYKERICGGLGLTLQILGIFTIIYYFDTILMRDHLLYVQNCLKL